MSDRWVFLTSFLTVVLVVAGAFAIPEYFSFELVRASIFVVIAVMTFFGEDRFSYMLGVVAPLLGFLLNILLGGFLSEFTTLSDYIGGKRLAKTDTPLHGFAILTSAILVVLCFRAFRKQVPENFFGRTFVISLIISLIYVGVMATWYYFAFTGVTRMP